MLRGLNWNKVIFLGIFLAVVSMLATVSFIFELALKGYRPVWSAPASKESALENAYPAQVNSLFQKYILPNQPINQNNLTKLNEDLLALRVPSRYQQLHWQLVKNLDILKTDASIANKQSARLELGVLQQQYQWLSKTLAQLLLVIY
jgi:hypothetical protein